jgi:hypothetical protein
MLNAVCIILLSFQLLILSSVSPATSVQAPGGGLFLKTMFIEQAIHHSFHTLHVSCWVRP